jgi:uncharacterized membrane-anchored protein YitT (DUF2179 family)
MIGSLFMAIGVNVFLIHNHLLDGGTFGIGLILHYLLGIQVGLVAIIISIPVFVFAWFHNRTFFYNSLHGMLFSSFIIDFSFHPLRTLGNSFNQDPMVSAILGGILVGSGIGLMLRFDTSIGGTDLLGQIIANYANINPGVVIFLIDLCIVTIGSLIISGGSIVLSIITVTFVGTTTSLLSIKRKKYKVQIIL